jgi:uncharacterized membrane protein HdeD (DUF308 family)
VLVLAHSSPAAAYALGTIFLVVGIGIAITAFVARSQFRAALSAWPGVEGEVVGLRAAATSSDSARTYARIYAFQTMDGHVVRGEALGGMSSSARSVVGDHFHVIYDPGDSSRFYTVPREGAWLLPLIGTIFVAIGILVLGLVVGHVVK